MAENPRNVDELLFRCRLRQSKQQVIIAGSGKVCIHASIFFKKVPLYQKEAADIVRGFQKLGIEIRLELRLKEPVAIERHPVIVRIKQHALRMLIDNSRKGKERVWCRKILLPTKEQILPLRLFKLRENALSDSRMLRLLRHMESGFLLFKGMEHLMKVNILCLICQTNLEIPVSLVLQIPEKLL